MLLRTVTAEGEDAVTLTAGAEGRVWEAMITGATCYESWQDFNTKALERDT